jgi:hypothetical protein
MNFLGILFFLLLSAIQLSTAHADDIKFDMLAATPVGSWQVREEITTDHKGRKTGSIFRSSVVGTEVRDGEPHYWVEMEIESFKISKKGKRKPQGDTVIMKSLVSESTLTGDPANVLGNLRGFGVETIIQNGKEKPMRFTNSGGLVAGAMKAANVEIEYDFTAQGAEAIEVAAGQFDTTKLSGTGSAEMKIVFKKIHVESETTLWLSDNVPFLTVKVEGTSTTNGKQSSHQSELLEFGTTGAVSKITGEIQDAPEMPKLGELFGQ